MQMKFKLIDASFLTAENNNTDQPMTSSTKATDLDDSEEFNFDVLSYSFSNEPDDLDEFSLISDKRPSTTALSSNKTKLPKSS